MLQWTNRLTGCTKSTILIRFDVQLKNDFDFDFNDRNISSLFTLLFPDMIIWKVTSHQRDSIYWNDYLKLSNRLHINLYMYMYSVYVIVCMYVHMYVLFAFLFLIYSICGVLRRHSHRRLGLANLPSV